MIGFGAGRWVGVARLWNVRPRVMRHVLLIVCCLALAGCGLDESTSRSDKPLTLKAARKIDCLSSLPFPPSTTDVYYFFHAGGLQECEFLVRFTVDPRDLEKAVGDLLLDNDRMTREHHFYTYVAFAGSPRLPEFGEYKPMPWWSPDAVTNGIYRASTNGQPFAVWADVTHHTIYLCETD